MPQAAPVLLTRPQGATPLRALYVNAPRLEVKRFRAGEGEEEGKRRRRKGEKGAIGMGGGPGSISFAEPREWRLQ